MTHTHSLRAASQWILGSRNHSALSISAWVVAVRPSVFTITGSGRAVKVKPPSVDQYRYCSWYLRIPSVGFVASTTTPPAPKPAVLAVSTTPDPDHTGKFGWSGKTAPWWVKDTA